MNAQQARELEYFPVEAILQWLRTEDNPYYEVIADEIEARGFLEMENENIEATEATVNELDRQLIERNPD